MQLKWFIWVKRKCGMRGEGGLRTRSSRNQWEGVINQSGCIYYLDYKATQKIGLPSQIRYWSEMCTRLCRLSSSCMIHLRLTYLVTWCYRSDVYEPGHEYVYRYEGHVLSGVPKMSSQFAGLKIDADVILQFLPNDNVIGKVRIATQYDTDFHN